MTTVRRMVRAKMHLIHTLHEKRKKHELSKAYIFCLSASPFLAIPLTCLVDAIADLGHGTLPAIAAMIIIIVLTILIYGYIQHSKITDILEVLQSRVNHEKAEELAVLISKTHCIPRTEAYRIITIARCSAAVYAKEDNTW